MTALLSIDAISIVMDFAVPVAMFFNVWMFLEVGSTYLLVLPLLAAQYFSLPV